MNKMQVVTRKSDSENDTETKATPYHSASLSFEIVGEDRCVRAPPSLLVVEAPEGNVATTTEPARFKLMVINNDSPACVP